jgi:hypothetical protein
VGVSLPGVVARPRTDDRTGIVGSAEQDRVGLGSRKRAEQPGRPFGKGMKVPLSEEEQRILQEMEQKLREHDRGFVDRVSHNSHRLETSRGAKWSAFGFLAGTVLLLGTFRASLALAICAVLVMLLSALAFAQYLAVSDRSPRQDAEDEAPERLRSRRPVRGARSVGLTDEWSVMRKRMRSRFGHRD